MARVTCEVEINAPVESVWALMQDPARRGEWDFRVTGGRFTKDGHPTKGATFTVGGRMVWGYRFDMEYLAVQPLRQTVVRLVEAHGLPIASGAGSWTYLRDGADRTVVRSAFRFELKKPWSWLFDPWLMTPVMYWITKRSLKRLKRLIERENF
ncbi:SRPBCC family protein [Tumebacillus sp. ITR2]|uniref:SRPBCC family protein n=1 Tax=Tumebacillus amylolyticus TaxID=2801339 RepID=A0ABS1JAH3_9BACL|nr:SRPBCC family protein [Tumebacillus amylolyticus]MBL0387263.1 SRPBCC family protein [Tumebacillus amylolyticus]